MNENFNGFRMPAEWEPQNSVWIAWPYNKNDWPGLYQFSDLSGSDWQLCML